MNRKCFFFVLLVAAFPSAAQYHSQSEDPANPTWKQFHTTAAAHELLKAWNKAYPDLTRLYSIGETLKGTPLMVLEITNRQSGAN
jgi:hypothetical protein